MPTKSDAPLQRKRYEDLKVDSVISWLSLVRSSKGTLWNLYRIRYQDLYRVGFTIALAIHSFEGFTIALLIQSLDPIRSLDLI